MEIPERFTKMIGTEQRLGGPIFSSKEHINGTYKILKCRFGSGVIMDVDTLEELHPTVQLLVKNNSMKKSRWTNGFPAREIDLRTIS